MATWSEHLGYGSLWIWRHARYNWDRDLDAWQTADKAQWRAEEARIERGEETGPIGDWLKDHPDRMRDWYAGQQDCWRERVRRFSAILEFGCIFAALLIPHLLSAGWLGVTLSILFVALACAFDAIKSKNRKWTDRSVSRLMRTAAANSRPSGES